jgi:hypothetical protein
MEGTKIYSDNGQVLIAELPTSVVQLYDSMRQVRKNPPEKDLAAVYGLTTIKKTLTDEKDMETSENFLKKVGFQYPDDFLMYYIYKMLDGDVHRCGHCVHFREDVGGLCTKWRDYVGASYLMDDCFERRIETGMQKD